MSFTQICPPQNILGFESTNLTISSAFFLLFLGSHQHSLYLIYALLSRIELWCNYALFGGHFGQNLVGGGTQAFYWTGPGMAPIPRSTDCGLIQTKVTQLEVNFGEMFKDVRSSRAVKGISA